MTSTGQAPGPATAARWRGQAGRMEVWYVTCTEGDGTGWWFHYESVAPAAGDAYSHGWVACFPAAGTPILERFGPVATTHVPAAADLVAAGGCRIRAGGLMGSTGRLGWDLELTGDAPALFTFPRWAWEREVLPGAQVVDRPGATLTGRVTVDGATRDLHAVGAQAHIFSHGSAKRWGWLHCDLGGGDTLEVVAAVSHLPVLERLKPLPFVRLRTGGQDRPRDSLRAAIGARADVDFPQWRVRTSLGARRRLRATVEMTPQRCVQLEYPNPDGTSAYCVNSERADARIAVEQRVGGRWVVDGEWSIDGTAHAEVGASSPWPGVEVSGFVTALGESS